MGEIVLTEGPGFQITCKRCLAARAKLATLSSPQKAMMMRLAELAPEPEESPGGGMGRLGKTVASAWHRTAYSLKNRGLVQIDRFGDHFCARLTHAGRQWLFANGAS
jgi:hypothetical protein